jgi:hypothetical protein
MRRRFSVDHDAQLFNEKYRSVLQEFQFTCKGTRVQAVELPRCSPQTHTQLIAMRLKDNAKHNIWWMNMERSRTEWNVQLFTTILSQRDPGSGKRGPIRHKGHTTAQPTTRCDAARQDAAKRFNGRSNQKGSSAISGNTIVPPPIK